MKTLTALLFLTAPIWANEIPQAWTPDPNIQYTVEPASSGGGCDTTATSGPAASCAGFDFAPINHDPLPDGGGHHGGGNDPSNNNAPEPTTFLMCGTGLMAAVWGWRRK